MEIVFNRVSYTSRVYNFNYKFDEGKITGIIGKSGSEKSFIGYLIMGLVRPSSGEIIIDNSSKYNIKKIRGDIGYVYQNPSNHFICKKVVDEIGFGIKQYKFKLDKIDKQINDSLKMVGLDSSYLDREIKTLSSGEALRVAIATSLVLNPKVLVLDEVSVYLDANGKRDLSNLLKLLRDRYKKTIIVISNDIDFISGIIDNYVLMDEGKIVNTGNVWDIVDNYNIFMKHGMEISSIFKFIRLCKDRGILINYTNDIDELVKEVVDSVK